MAGKLLLINPARRRKASAKKRRASSRKRNPMPAGLARYFAKKGRRKGARRARGGGRVARGRRRNPIAVGGIVRKLQPMVVEAGIGAAGAIGMEYLWGKVNPMLPPSLQSAPGKVGVGEAVKVLATVLIGSVADRPTKGLAMRGARGALAVQLYNIARSMLPASFVQQLAYVGPAPVVQGTWWVGPNAVRRGASVSTMGALMRPGATPLLSGVGALMQPGGATPLLSGVRPSVQRLSANAPGGIQVRY